MSLSPLQLSPDYVKIQDKEYIEIHKPNKQKQFGSNSEKMSRSSVHHLKYDNPEKYNYLMLHGDGNIDKGTLYYNKQFNDRLEIVIPLLESIARQRLISDFAEYLNLGVGKIHRYRRSKINEGRFI